MSRRHSAKGQCGYQRRSEHRYVLLESGKKALRQEQYLGSLLPIESWRSRTGKKRQTASLNVSSSLRVPARMCRFQNATLIAPVPVAASSAQPISAEETSPSATPIFVLASC